jgi:hypothetical protein
MKDSAKRRFPLKASFAGSLLPSLNSRSFGFTVSEVTAKVSCGNTVSFDTHSSTDGIAFAKAADNIIRQNKKYG